MTKIDRKTQKIFGLNTANIGQFGSAEDGATVLSKDLDVLQGLTAYEQGWDDAVLGGDELPPLEEMNALTYINTSQLAYLFQQGLAEYDPDTEYFIASFVKEVGTTNIYQSLTDNNIGNPLNDPINWQLLDANLNNLSTNAIASNPITGQIAAGSITYTREYTRVDGEGSLDDNLDIINIGVGIEGSKVLLKYNGNGIVTVRDNNISGGNIKLLPIGSTVTLATFEDTLELIYDGNFWLPTNAYTASNITSTATINTVGTQYIRAQIELKNAATDLEHDIEFSSGNFFFSDGSGFAMFPTATTKQADATFALGNNAGGMASGESLPISGYIHCFALSSESGDVVDAGFDTDQSATNLLADPIVSAATLTKYRRVGSLFTDSAGNILGFTQQKKYFELLEPLEIFSGNVGNTAQTISNLATPAVNLGGVSPFMAMVNSFVQITSGAAIEVKSLRVFNPSHTDVAVTRSNSQASAERNSTNFSSVGNSSFLVSPDINGQLNIRASTNSSSQVVIGVRGWIDTYLR